MQEHSMKNEQFREKYGPWALIAGGSQGIGEAFARALAKKGLNLVLIARRTSLLQSLSKDIQKEYGVEVKYISQDLSVPNIVTNTNNEINGLQIGLLVYNAAIIPIGHYFSSDLEEQLKVINVNCRGPTLLIDYYGRLMKDRGKGGIILISSMAGFQGTPINVHYAATKAYTTVLAEGLWYEFKQYGIDVIASITGTTATPNYIATEPDYAGILVPKPLKPSKVAKEVISKLGKKPTVTPGFTNKIMSQFMKRLLPKKQAIKLIGSSTYKMYGKKIETK
jgi:short-subunit dehydrogenase